MTTPRAVRRPPFSPPCLNTFRREPARPQLDWSFTPCQSSSDSLATLNRSGFALTLAGSLRFGYVTADYWTKGTNPFHPI